MKTTIALAIAMLSLTAFQTQAAQTYVGATRSTMHVTMTPSSTSGASREQVVAELAAAKRSGDILATGESSLKLNEMYPSQYPAAQVLAGMTREQVKAELADAKRTGDYMVAGEISGKCNEIHPNMHTVM